jgi:hypothetical protein
MARRLASRGDEPRAWELLLARHPLADVLAAAERVDRGLECPTHLIWPSAVTAELSRSREDIEREQAEQLEAERRAEEAERDAERHAAESARLAEECRRRDDLRRAEEWAKWHAVQDRCTEWLADPGNAHAIGRPTVEKIAASERQAWVMLRLILRQQSPDLAARLEGHSEPAGAVA